jgi:hypothetical protein
VSDVESLRARVKQLEDERSVLELLSRYCMTIDTGRTAEWVDCFTEDGSFEVQDASGNELTAVRGRADLATYVEGLMTTVPPGTQDHVTVNAAVWVAGDQATADSYYMTVVLGEDGPRLRSRGRYRDRLARTDRGWRFRQRVATSMRQPQ